MKPSEWAELEKHFQALCELEESEQRQALERLSLSAACREQLEQLLVADRESSIDQFIFQVGRLSLEVDGEDMTGQSVGAYRLIRKLGEGGMGEVYLAARDDGRYQSSVAIKFLAMAGARGQRLFDRERQVLGRLNHPGIASMIDAGEHPALGAYLVMEYVEGDPIHALARQGSVGVLKTIGWMIEACQAVAFAHQNLVLHRDLKPEHLLINRNGQLKILDFGVAGLMQSQSEAANRTQQASFTLRYAAPEQILNQLTSTRTDVYALGVILYELISDGAGPFGDDSSQMVERKLAGELTRLPRHRDLNSRQLRDLHAVIARCLSREPDQRFSGPGELTTELQAIIRDRPVATRRPPWTERLWRWVGRHRIAGSAAVLAAMAIIGGIGFSTWFAYRAQVERQIAIQKADQAREVTTFLESLFASATPGAQQGPDIMVRDLLERGRARIESELAEQPEIAAYLELAMARSYMFLGLYKEALELLETHRVIADPDTFHERVLLAARIDNLNADYRQALDRMGGVDPALLSPMQAATLALQQAVSWINLGQHEQAAASAQQAVSMADDSQDGLALRSNAHNLIGVIAFNRSDFDAAGVAFEDYLAVQIQLKGEIHDATGLALHNLGGVALMKGDLDAALGYYERAARVYEAFFGVENRAVAMNHRSMGLTLRRMGHAEAAELSLRASVAAYQNWGGHGHPAWFEAVLQLAELLLIQGQSQAAGLVVGFELPQDSPERIDERQVLCRLGRVQAYLSGDSATRHCWPEMTLPDSALAFDHFLSALVLKAAGEQGFGDALERSRQLLAGLKVPDPLLLAALDRL